MNPDKFVLKISSPCHENWDEMDSAANSKFCNSCKKNVFDLTDFYDDELAKIAQKYPDGFCGRLTHDQINKPITQITKSKHRLPFLRGIAASALTATTLLSNIKGVAQTSKTEIVADIKNDEKKNDDSKQSTRISNKRICGHVIDSTNKGNIGIANVLVKIDGSSNFTTTDRWGYYELTVPEIKKNKTFGVSIEKVGYYSFGDFMARYGELPLKHNFYPILDEKRCSTIMLGGISIIKSKKQPWLKSIFKKKN